MSSGSGTQTGMLIVWIILVVVVAVGFGAYYYLPRRRRTPVTRDDRARQRSEPADE